MQRSHLSATWVVALLVVASLTATGCAVAGTGSGTNSSVVNVQGSFATANLSAAIVARSSARSILPGYNIRIYTMSGASFSANDYETVSIQSDGAFSFEVPRGDTFVAILVDTQAPFRKAVGVIGIGTAVGQYWEQIATSELDGDIVMGNVATTPTDDGVLPSQVGLTDMLDKVKDSSAIDRLSRLDNAVRLLMNAINGEPGISTTLNYIFGQTDTEFETILGQFPTDIAYGFAGYQVLLFPSTGAGGATLSAPAEGTLITLGNNAATGTISGTPWNGHFEFGQGDRPGDSLIQQNPAEYWTLSLDGQEAAEFNFGVLPPTVGAPANPKIAFPVPLVKITPKDSDADVIGSISIKWVLWNETTDQYEEIPPAEIARTCDPHYFHIDVRDYRFSDAGERDEVQFDPNAGDITFNRDWHVKEPVETTDSSKLWAESISLGYGTPAIQALFSIRQDRQYSYN